MKLTKAELAVLQALLRHPNGIPFPDPEQKEAVLSLADKVLVCDPHRMGDALFTRITEEGKALIETINRLSQELDESPFSIAAGLDRLEARGLIERR